MTQIKEKTEKELLKMLNETREEVRKFRFGMSGANKKNSGNVSEKKKLIAQILTELNSRKKSK